MVTEVVLLAGAGERESGVFEGGLDVSGFAESADCVTVTGLEVCTILK